MKSVIREILQGLCDEPDQVRLTEIHGKQTVLFELRCHPDDVGTLIGKNGKTISAIRTVIAAIAARDGLTAVLEVIE